jgi:cytidine deaminase
MTERELIDLAFEAKTRSYSPYSHFSVGAALLCEDGSIYLGCNIENASYGATNCAERTAIFKAVSEGKREFTAIAIVAAPEGEPLRKTAPCGVCRQVMMEFCDPATFRIISAASDEDYEVYTLEQLMPKGFGPSDL